MLVLRHLDPIPFVPLFLGGPQTAGRPMSWWEEGCAKHGLQVLAVEEDDVLAGFVLLAVRPAAVYVRHIEGGPDACRLLLDGVIRLADGRHISGWFPTDMHAMLQEAEFTAGERDTIAGRACGYYRLGNDDDA